MDSISKDLLELCLRHLRKWNDLYNACLVCKAWNQVVKRGKLFSALCPHLQPEKWSALAWQQGEDPMELMRGDLLVDKTSGPVGDCRLSVEGRLFPRSPGGRLRFSLVFTAYAVRFTELDTYFSATTNGGNDFYRLIKAYKLFIVDDSRWSRQTQQSWSSVAKNHYVLVTYDWVIEVLAECITITLEDIGEDGEC